MSSGGGFWATVELLTGMGGRIAQLVDPFNEDIEDWLETMANRVKMQQERAKIKSVSDSEGDGDEPVYGGLLQCK